MRTNGFVSWLRLKITQVVSGENAGFGDSEFVALLEKHRDQFYRFIYRNAWNPADADDIFSEAVMVAWEKRDNFRAGSNFKAWFYKILLNKSFVFNRHTGRHPVSTDEVEIAEPEEESVDVTASGSFDFTELLNDNLLMALNTLREPERVCLCLRAVEDYSYKEIAEIMEIPIGTVMTHLARSRKKVKQALITQSAV